MELGLWSPHMGFTYKGTPLMGALLVIWKWDFGAPQKTHRLEEAVKIGYF